MNAQDISEIFNKIRKSSNDEIITQPLTVDRLNRIILIYKDNKGLAHILMESNEGYVDFDEIKGIGISNKSFKIKGFKQQRFYEYYSRHQRFHIIFFPFITDVLTRLTIGEDIVRAHKSSLKLWKNCFEDPEGNILSRDREVGLIGEFIFLIKLIDKNFDEAVESWNGPLGGVDFVMNRNRVEVKTTLKESHTHTINGIEQLSNKRGTNLFLSSIQLQSAHAQDNGSFSLASKYNEIINYLKEDPVLINQFQLKIKYLGISHEIIEIHDFRKYIEIDFKIFNVNNEFPKITSDNLKIPLSSRISQVRYDVDLDGLENIDIDFLLNE